MEQHNYKYFSIQDSRFKWQGDLESLKHFIADDLNLSGKWSSLCVKAFTTGGDIVKIKWYQGVKKHFYFKDLEQSK